MLFTNPNSAAAPVQIQLVPLSPHLTIDEIDSLALIRLMRSGEPLQIFDLRHFVDWQKEHVPGARSKPAIKGESTAVRNGCIHDIKAVLYSYAGAGPTTRLIASELESIGCSVCVLKGGWEAWSSSGNPVEGEEALKPFSQEIVTVLPSEPRQHLFR
jgi:rhodanese-related sulfurtransferase